MNIAEKTSGELNAEKVMTLPSYVVVTPARNEEKLIEATIRAVISQTVLPLKWVIISDGSTDRTDEIVRQYADQYPWIELLRMPERRERHFAGKAYAIMAGLERMAGLPYEVIVSLDADITFEQDYFAYLLEKLAEDPQLGIVGTPYQDIYNEIYDYRFVRAENIAGACQVFRRACYEEIGGYQPIKGGAIDTIASLTARMKGWKTKTFTEKYSLHHRVVASVGNSVLKARFILGKRDWAVGNHPVWEVFRSIYQMSKPPYVLRGLAILTGYVWAALTRPPRPVSPQLRAFRRREQMEHLARVLSGDMAEDDDAPVKQPPATR